MRIEDAMWLAELLAHGLIRASLVPDAQTHEMRSLLRTRKQLVREQSSHVLRVQKTLEDANIKPDSLLSDLMAKSSRAMIEALILLTARKAMPPDDLKGLIAWLKANPDKTTLGVAGTGGGGHIAGFFFQKETGTWSQFVPYRGASPAIQDLVSGQIDMVMADPIAEAPDERRERPRMLGLREHLHGVLVFPPRRRERACRVIDVAIVESAVHRPHANRVGETDGIGEPITPTPLSSRSPT
jgi:Tripartite tricarboxylate transporter family receptor